MARIRSVHPDICTDEALVNASAAAERLYVRLWTHLDDDGRCVDNALLLKAALFPIHQHVTAKHIGGWVDELVSLGCLFRYEHAGRHYLTVKPDRWSVWQKPRRKVDSKLPAPASSDLVQRCADNVGTRSDTDGQRPPGGVGVGVEGDGDGLGAEGESEGEVGAAGFRPQAVENATVHQLVAEADRLATVASWRNPNPAANGTAS